MKIGVLTLKLETNYGGLLQAYALQTTLQRMGHNPVFLQRYNADLHKLSWGSIARYSKMMVARLKGTKVFIPAQQSIETIKQNTDIFVNGYFSRSPILRSTRALKSYTEKEGFDAYVVGSDQVWRPGYSTCLPNYFLDFAEKSNVKRVAYAASFGVDKWEFRPKDEKVCVPLAQKFDAISVREESGVRLCREHLGVTATPVLDPTLLLNKSDYVKLIEEAGEEKRKGNLFCYVLDKAKVMDDVVNYVSNETGLTPFFTMPKYKLNKENEKNHLEECVFPRVTEWLRSFMDADMVITDSFHGCVFSILFNKPFWVVGNQTRGMARFDSLLSAFDLKSRMVTVDSIKEVNINTPIDWDKVENKRNELREISIDFLKAAL